ncbi:MAG TPA: glycosyltransferase family 4 protein [Candidatus Acidoferrum sp.]|nr:glycosyltransferase family 4 protein [Candidatus Acidoferrum sp.]
MNVVHISTFDRRGGAARAAYRLHDGLQRVGQKSCMFVLEKISYESSVVRYEPPGDMLSRLGRAVRKRTVIRAASRYQASSPAGLTFFTDDRTIYGRDLWQQIPGNDLIQLHWISGFVDYRSFFAALPLGKPVVWTLHGMDSLTGGCFYDKGCGRFTGKCGACPQLGSANESDLTRQVWERKWECYSRLGPAQMHIVTPSRWLKEEVKRSALLSSFPCTVIPNGLDTDVFFPRSRSVSREILCVPPDAKVVLFIADGLNDPRKGFHILAEALAETKLRDNLFLISLGPGYPPSLQGIPHVHVESLNNDRFLSYVYSAADVFVVPSLQDNLPNTAMESIACGTPVVGFAVGGIPDLVRPGLTGSLAKPGDALDLRKAIAEILSDDERLKKMAANCRKIAVEEYTIEIQARRYLEVYGEALQGCTVSR